jgi:hypothetical protein
MTDTLEGINIELEALRAKVRLLEETTTDEDDLDELLIYETKQLVALSKK